jgi:hypothetical protein
LLTSSLARAGQNLAAPLLVLVTVALLLKSAAALTLFRPGDASLWLTPGAMLGIPAGIGVYLGLAWLPRTLLPAVAAALLLGGAALVNVAPANPYTVASVLTWTRGHFLSFNGTTRLVSSLWPLLAAGYLIWWGRGQGALARAPAVGGTTNPKVKEPQP